MRFTPLIQSSQQVTIVANTQKGFTLIELMISILLGSFLMLGLFQLFQSSSQTNRLQNAYARTMENALVAIELLSRDIRMADFRGCSAITAITNHLDTTDSDYDAATMDFLAQGLDGQNNVNNQTIDGTSVINNTDVLLIRGSRDACSGTGRMMPSLSSASMFVSTDCEVEANQIVMLSNCSAGELFTITNVTPATVAGNTKKTIVHNTGNPAAGAVKNTTKTFAGIYSSESYLLVPYVKQYFLAEGTNGPSLFVNDSGIEQELVPGVTSLQFEYGEDTNGDGAVDTYKDAATANMDEVINIRTTLVVTNGDHTEGFDTVTNIRNRR
ncbi:MAG: type IV pilus assembly protein PilW [Oleiphilaceae bacterium]